MPRLIGIRKKNIAVFISGTGSNLKNLIDHSLKRNSKFKINLVISNRIRAQGLKYANKYKIDKKIFDYSNIKHAEKNILTQLKKKDISSETELFVFHQGFKDISTTKNKIIIPAGLSFGTGSHESTILIIKN